MPILDPKLVRKALDGDRREHTRKKEVEREFNSFSARKRRASEIELLLRESLTHDVRQIMTGGGKTTERFHYYYAHPDYDERKDATLSVHDDGLRHSELPGTIWRGWGSFWKGLATTHQVAMKLAKDGVTPKEVGTWLEKALGPVRHFVEHRSK